MRSSEIRLRKLKLRLRDKRFANHKAPCTVVWQQPLQSVLALRGSSAMDFNLIGFLRSPEVHLRPYISPPLIPVLSKVHPVPSITIHLYHHCDRRVTTLPSPSGPGFDPRCVSFPGFFLNWRQMLGKLRSQPSPDIIGHHNHQTSFYYGRQWPPILTRSI